MVNDFQIHFWSSGYWMAILFGIATITFITVDSVLRLRHKHNLSKCALPRELMAQINQTYF